MTSIISTQVRDELDIDEWVRYHLGIGFDHIVIYDNMSVIPVENIWNNVTVIKEDREFESSENDNCHNDTIKNFDADWVARIDVDEFIVLKKHKKINNFLKPFSEYGGVGINWRIFGTSGHKTKPKGFVRDNYVWRMPDNCGWILNGGSYQLKTIIRREFCIQVHHPHFCRSSRPLVDEDFHPYTDAWTDSSRTQAVIHHYVTKSRDEWNAKYDLWRHRFGLRSEHDLEDIERNCIVYDNSLKTKNMEIGKTWQWASHQPLIKGVLKLYEPKFILELGIGENSTPLFQGYYYLGIENNKEWIDTMGCYNMNFLWHDLDRTELTDFYRGLTIPDVSPRLLFVDNYETCRLIAINTLRDKFDIIIFHDCEPEPGARVNHYGMINSEGFNVYFLKTPLNWTGVMIRNDKGFNELLNVTNPFIKEFKIQHPEMQWMILDSRYESAIN